MKLKKIKFFNAVHIGSYVETFLLDTHFDMDLKGNYVEIKSLRQNKEGKAVSCFATIYNVVWFEPAETEAKNSLKNAV